MAKFRLPVLIITTLGLMSLILFGIVGFSQSPQSKIQLTTDPPIGQISPFEAEAVTPQSPVRLTLQALNPTGQVLENSKFRLQIFAPTRNPFFPTDFPVVEGTQLLDLEAIAPEGKLQIQQMLPIRGKYQLLVNVTPVVANQFSPIQQTLTLDVSESWVKYRNFCILAGILLVVGIVGGLIMGGKQVLQPGEIAPARVRLLLSGVVILAIATLLVVNINAEMAESHNHEHSLPTENPVVVNPLGVKLKLTGDHYATVGQVANLKIQALNTTTNQPATDVVFNIKTIQLEDHWLAFAYQGVPDATGQLAWQQQFFDGAPHKLEVEVSPLPNTALQFQPLQANKVIEVEGVAPPLAIRLIVLTYFTGIVVLGLALGLWLRQGRKSLSWKGSRI
jgi:hypothetical protein